MNELRGWLVILWRVAWYVAYRAGLCKCPKFSDCHVEIQEVIKRFMGWDRSLRIRGAEHCPAAGPAIIVGNHMKRDDPFFLFHVIYLITKGTLDPFIMMREGFFPQKSIFKSRLFDADEALRLLVTLQISRDNIRLSQMKPFITVLREGGSFLMYPGRTRSRSGVFAEYRDDVTEPGSVGFFLAQAQRNRPELRIPVALATRTYNPVSKCSPFVFGECQYLAHDADRDAVRAFDFALTDQMADLVEVNVSQVVSALLYLRCLHSLGDLAEIPALERLTQSVFAALPDTRLVDPAANTDLPREIRRTLKYLRSHKMLRVKGSTVHLDRPAILAAPELDSAYIEKNPVKYLTNQILHLPDVISAIENAALGL